MNRKTTSLTRTEKLAAVQANHRVSRIDYRGVDFLDGADGPYVQEMMMAFQSSAMKKISKDVQTKLIEICADKAKGRPAGGARGLLQFSVWLFLKGENQWALPNDRKLRLSNAAQFCRWDGASLLRGHDTMASPEDIQIADKQVLFELEHWYSTTYANKLLKEYAKAQAKVISGFQKMVQSKTGDRWDKRSASTFLTKCMLARLNRPGPGISGLQYGAAAYGLINRVMFKIV